ncbi:hypothetical protein KKF91_04600 [Myxococcota bacterium]|nr:hypothetical protein [Myxococcota bacterium]MBU1429827.1 hypothetical protein [Myxococcota bacterium]MBU1898410.1 hypothetical protein [Myxococcota bacterium]
MQRPQIQVACAFDGPLSLYWEQGFNAREVALGHNHPKTLNRWRKGTPEGAAWVVVTRMAAFNAATAPELEAATARAAALGAETLLLITPASLRPTRENAEAMIRFFKARGEGPRIAWWAEGLWESQHEIRDEICAATGLIPAVDPLAPSPEGMEAPPPPEGAFFYWRVMGSRGLSGRLSDFELDQLYGLTVGREAGIIAFTAEGMHRDAKAFQQLLVST